MERNEFTAARRRTENHLMQPFFFFFFFILTLDVEAIVALTLEKSRTRKRNCIRAFISLPLLYSIRKSEIPNPSYFLYINIGTYIPVVLRALLVLSAVYALVIVIVFYGAFVDAREMGGRYYVFTSGKYSQNILYSC